MKKALMRPEKKKTALEQARSALKKADNASTPRSIAQKLKSAGK